MKLKLAYYIMIAVVFSTVLAACGSDERKDTSDKLQSEKNELSLDINESISKIDDKIADLRNDLNGASEDAKDEINDQIDKLKGDKDDLNDKLAELRDATEENWEEFKSGVNASLESVDSTFTSFTEDNNSKG